MVTVKSCHGENAALPIQNLIFFINLILIRDIVSAKNKLKLKLTRGTYSSINAPFS